MTGFGANAGELVSAAGSIRGAADPIRDDYSKKISDLEMNGSDFGKAHQNFFSGYHSAMDKLAKCATSMADAMDDFAKRIEDASKSYGSSDADAAHTVGRSGGN